MDDNSMYTASTPPTTPATMTALAATVAELKAKVKPMPRDVFVYPGPMDAFKAVLAASGVEVCGEVAPPGAVSFPFGLRPIGDLECYEVDGEVWIAGSYRDFQDARDGKIPFKWLKPGPR
jgi:hypothetical protein